VRRSSASWATLADVLTFYQERIANELWLRTATERDSLLRLALRGYRQFVDRILGMAT